MTRQVVVNTPATAAPALRALLARLDLDATGPDAFRTSADHEGVVRIFGGQVAAQALTAMGRTVDASRHVHSLHVRFVRPGRLGLPLDLQVTRLKEGRSFDVRQVDVRQGGVLVTAATASFHVAEDGPAAAASTALPGAPSGLPRWEEQFADHRHRLSPLWAGPRPMDLRYVGTPAPLDPQLRTRATTGQQVFIRSDGPLPDDELLHAGLLVYATDAVLLETAVLPLGVVWADGRFEGASLDHAMWFHRPPRADRWLLFDQRAEALGGARGLASGRLVDEEGHVVGSVLQEGLLRPVDGDTWMARR